MQRSGLKCRIITCLPGVQIGSSVTSKFASTNLGRSSDDIGRTMFDSPEKSGVSPQEHASARKDAVMLMRAKILGTSKVLRGGRTLDDHKLIYMVVLTIH